MGICISIVLSLFVQLGNMPNNGFELNKTKHDFGSIPQNQEVEAFFIIKNTSNSPLIITAIEKQCGCTTTGYSSEPIASKQSDTISISYDAAKTGAFTKKVTLKTNLGEEDLFIRGKVI